MTKLDEIGLILTAGRQKNQELSPFARAAICGAVAAGASQAAVARAFGLSRHAVQATLQRFATTHTFVSQPKSGRPEVLTHREKRYIIQLTKRFPRLTVSLLTNTLDTRVSPSTVRRHLRQQNRRKWRAKKRIPLSKVAARYRYWFACDSLDNLDVVLRVSGL